MRLVELNDGPRCPRCGYSEPAHFPDFNVFQRPWPPAPVGLLARLFCRRRRRRELNKCTCTACGLRFEVQAHTWKMARNEV